MPDKPPVGFLYNEGTLNNLTDRELAHYARDNPDRLIRELAVRLYALAVRDEGRASGVR